MFSAAVAFYLFLGIFLWNPSAIDLVQMLHHNLRHKWMTTINFFVMISWIVHICWTIHDYLFPKCPQNVQHIVFCMSRKWLSWRNICLIKQIHREKRDETFLHMCMCINAWVIIWATTFHELYARALFQSKDYFYWFMDTNYIKIRWS